MGNDWDDDYVPVTADYRTGTAETLTAGKRTKRSRCAYGFKFVDTDRKRRARSATKRRK